MSRGAPKKDQQLRFLNLSFFCVHGAYRNITLTAGPDVGDIRKEGRRSRVGCIPRGETHGPRYENGIVRHADGRRSPCPQEG